MKYLFIIFIFLFFNLSCSEFRKSTSLEIALNVAGENRKELEKVLAVYAGNPSDSLKYKAACFLIENMPGHYSYEDTAYIDCYYNAIDSVAEIYEGKDDYVKDSLYRAIKNRYKGKQLKPIADIHCITSDFLIANIEAAFRVWQDGEWATHVNFEDFCEYILPYKVVEAQAFDNWREYLFDYCNGDLKNLHYCDPYKNSAITACKTVNRELKNAIRPRFVNEEHIPVRRMSTLPKIPFGICDDYCTITLSVMRAKGIPVAVDFTPQWPFRSQGHSWNVILVNSGKNAVFDGAQTDPGDVNRDDSKMAKIFRYTYAINKEIKAIHLSERYVPSVFENVFMKDVTAGYLLTEDIEVAVDSRKNDAKYAYLAVFDNTDWVPVQWGKITGKKVKFEKMGKDVVYMPVFYNDKGVQPFSYPILLTIQGKKLQLKADTLTRQTLNLYRKFPAHQSMYEVGGRMIGGKIQVATDSLFTDSLTLYTITDYRITPGKIDLSRLKDSFRYWRYYPPDDMFGNIAELFFYEKDSINPITGRMIGTNGSWANDKKHRKEVVFDKDALTFFNAPRSSGCWVGLDFGRPIAIEKIIYYQRSDGNSVEIGNEYELFYWGNNTWQSLGRKKANDIVLTYENCPTNALFLLKNLTKGKEERIFTYRNGKQIWW